eukprot:CAMPEP_0177281852 /NCGR_PEP_ID=MMETSP0367-20130122/71136_1 /TAXON_ID=447022 ORGANISM="Scrippsiella hangoei-like, Strain SHHI-4" /NCGR_SAMPLE_ID=MMETSP0367 /ASSEMBLY_ACC=CAM_ASM_000362 /LENGTH=106 /DNA_ID=CAMNT_0018738711 /DNA_START=20 /DNA_END=337 /DNA_ORIENTATION=+
MARREPAQQAEDFGCLRGIRLEACGAGLVAAGKPMLQRLKQAWGAPGRVLQLGVVGHQRGQHPEGGQGDRIARTGLVQHADPLLRRLAGRQQELHLPRSQRQALHN